MCNVCVCVRNNTDSRKVGHINRFWNCRCRKIPSDRTSRRPKWQTMSPTLLSPVAHTYVMRWPNTRRRLNIANDCSCGDSSTYWRLRSLPCVTPKTRGLHEIWRREIAVNGWLGSLYERTPSSATLAASTATTALAPEVGWKHAGRPSNMSCSRVHRINAGPATFGRQK